MVKHLVIHNIFKDQNDKNIKTDYSQTLLDPRSDEVDNFFHNFIKATSGNRGSFAYTAFLTDSNDRDEKYRSLPMMSDYIDSYYSGIKDDKSFLDISLEIAKLYSFSLALEPLSTGGYLIVFDYSDDGKEMFAVTLMIQEIGSAVEEHLLKTVKALNMKQMALAALINRKKWADTKNGDNINYIKLVCGQKELSGYYKDGFIGCQHVTKSTKATKTFMEAIEKFMTSIKEDNISWESERSMACRIMTENRDEVYTEHLLNVLLPNPTHQDQFWDFCNRNQYEISASFKPSKLIYKSWQKLMYEKNGIKIDISRDRMEDRTARYDNKKKELIIKDNDGGIFKEWSMFVDGE